MPEKSVRPQKRPARIKDIGGQSAEERVAKVESTSQPTLSGDPGGV